MESQLQRLAVLYATDLRLWNHVQSCDAEGRWNQDEGHTCVAPANIGSATDGNWSMLCDTKCQAVRARGVKQDGRPTEIDIVTRLQATKAGGCGCGWESEELCKQRRKAYASKCWGTGCCGNKCCDRLLAAMQSG